MFARGSSWLRKALLHSLYPTKPATSRYILSRFKVSEWKPYVVVRRGHLEDKQAVLDIDATADGGRDYLSAKYDLFCKDKRRIGYITEADGLPVSYAVATIVDDGEGVIFEAGRTHPEHRQQGYIKYLTKAAVKELKALYPNLKELLYVHDCCTPNESRLSLVRFGDKVTPEAKQILLSKGLHFCDLSEPKARLKVKTALEKLQHCANGVEKIEFNKLEEFLKKDDFKKHFETDRVIIGFVPYKLDKPSNFALSHRFPESFHISYNKQGLIDGVSFSDVWIDKGRDYERHFIDLYCSSKEAFLKHLAFYYGNMIRKQKYMNVYSETLCPVYVDNETSEKLVEKTFGLPLLESNDARYLNLYGETACIKHFEFTGL